MVCWLDQYISIKIKMGKLVLFLTLLGVLGALSAPLAGGKSPITDENKINEFVSLLQTHLGKATLSTGDAAQLEFVKVINATSQVVAGKLYDVFAEMKEAGAPVVCKVTLWEKPWAPVFIDLKLTCGSNEYVYAVPEPEEPEVIPAIGFGGYQDMTDAGIKEIYPIVSTVFEQLAAADPEFDVVFGHISSAKFQVVAGTNYDLVVDAKHGEENPKCKVVINESLEHVFNFKINCDHKVKEFTHKYVQKPQP